MTSSKVLITGGAGFIGRWVTRCFLQEGHSVWILDDYSNGNPRNLEEFRQHAGLRAVIDGDIRDSKLLNRLFNEHEFSLCVHLAANVVVDDSLSRPQEIFEVDTGGTIQLLECCRRKNTKMVFMSTCMVYASSLEPLSEASPVSPHSPYAAAKLSSENWVISYFHAYGLPTVVLRPFNTYGPYQKTDREGGVVARFLLASLNGEPLQIFGTGTQTRDLLYVEDCAEFIYKASQSPKAVGQILNAGTGRDIPVLELAKRIAGPKSSTIKPVDHPHPQSEIQKLCCDWGKAETLLDWRPQVSLEEGLERTRQWIDLSQLRPEAASIS